MMLELLMHGGESAQAQVIAAEEAFFRDRGPRWCAKMIGLAHLIVPAVDAIEVHIKSLDRRLRQNMATLLVAAFVASHSRVPTPEEAQHLARQYEKATATHEQQLERDDGAEALAHLFAYQHERYTLGHWLAVLHSGQDAEKGEAFSGAKKNVAMFDLVLRMEGDNPGLFLKTSRQQ